MKVLQLLTDLVKFGYYDDPADVGVLLPAIHKLLNLTERPLTERFAARRQTDSAVTFKEECKECDSLGVALLSPPPLLSLLSFSYSLCSPFTLSLTFLLPPLTCQYLNYDQ